MEPNAPARDRQEPSRPTKSEQARSMARARAVARPAPSARPKAGKRNRPTRITDPAGQSAAERTVPQAPGLAEGPQHLKYGGRAPKARRRRATEVPRKAALGLPIAKSSQSLPNFDGQFELIEDDELK